jgi:hypothetical protein
MLQYINSPVSAGEFFYAPNAGTFKTPSDTQHSLFFFDKNYKAV